MPVKRLNTRIEREYMSLVLFILDVIRSRKLNSKYNITEIKKPIEITANPSLKILL